MGYAKTSRRRVALRFDVDNPPFNSVTITGHAAADEYADRNGVPGEMVVRVMNARSSLRLPGSTTGHRLVIFRPLPGSNAAVSYGFLRVLGGQAFD